MNDVIRIAATALAVVLVSSALPALADEGMWTLDNFPVEKVKSDHGVEISSDWMRKVQLSTVRLGGCTGSFVSDNGLILTNNHCVWGCIRNLSTDENNLSDTGFLAAETAEELQCPGMRLSVLHASEEITAKVHEATAGMDEVAANEARKALLSSDRPTFAEIEDACAALPPVN